MLLIASLLATCALLILIGAPIMRLMVRRRKRW
jgi:hypothetical protein